MRLFINDIEVDNYAFIKEIYQDRIVLDKEITLQKIERTDSVFTFPRVYSTISCLSVTGAKGNTIYLDNEVNWHFNRESKGGRFHSYLTYGALITPGNMPEAVRWVLYSLFKKNKLRVAGTRYAEWQMKKTFPDHKDFELAWRFENRLGTHNPNYIKNSELCLDTCDFCMEGRTSDAFRCTFYCGENRKRLRKQILETSM